MRRIQTCPVGAAALDPVSHSEYIAGLVAADLVKKGFLGRELATQAGGKKKGRKKATKGKRR